jgi:hypothetical protein
MPLSATDLQYFSRCLDRRLKNARWWPFTRIVLLLAGLSWVGAGIAQLTLATKLSNAFTELITIPVAATTRVASSPSATQPVTRREFYQSQQTQDLMIVAQSQIAANAASWQWLGFLHLAGGSAFALLTLARWNRHRRDILLITFLRDKFPELV